MNRKFSGMRRSMVILHYRHECQKQTGLVTFADQQMADEQLVVTAPIRYCALCGKQIDVVSVERR